jgi:ribosomal 50S subunit-associated protein YjgA (DUF615 family)
MVDPLILNGFLVGTLSLLCGALLFVIRQQQQLTKLLRSESKGPKDFARIFHQVDDLLTSVKWHTELLLSQDAGTLNIAQQQLVHKIDTSINEAMNLFTQGDSPSGSDVMRGKKQN